MRLSIQDALKAGGLLFALGVNYALTKADVSRLAEKVEAVNPVVLEQRLGEINAGQREIQTELRLLREEMREALKTGRRR